MSITFYRIVRTAMFLNAIFGAFLAGGLVMAGDLLHSVITLGACATSVLILHLVGAAEREEFPETTR
jgi:hypothetical protein